MKKNKTYIECFHKNHKEFRRNNKSILKTRQIHKNEIHDDFTEEIALSSKNDKSMELTYSIETYAYGTSKNLASEKE